MFNRNMFKDVFNSIFKSEPLDLGIDKLKLKGIFDLEVHDLNGNKVQEIKENNIIVNTSFDIIKSLFVDGANTARLSAIQLGDGGVFNNSLKTPLRTETALYNSLVSKSIPTNYTDADVLVDSINQNIRFTWIFDVDEANGAGVAIYNEAGFFSNSGIMFSKKNFNEIIKDNQKTIIINWTIQF